MTKIGWFFRLSNQQPTEVTIQRMAAAIGSVILIVMTAGSLLAQDAKPAAPSAGYSVHQSADLGGHVSSIVGSGAMYDTLVNQQSGPRVLGETFEMRALPDNKHPLFDVLSAAGSGFGGDANNFARMNISKGRLYEFTGLFRRDRQYFDYDLLGNPNIPGGQSIAIGPSSAPTGKLAWPQVTQSTVMFNTVRRMTDTSLTLLPLSKVTYRAAYAQNIFQGPSLTPSGYQFATGDAILEEFQRNSTDDFTGTIEWKPFEGTRLSFTEQVDHYKADSYFILAPADFIAQEADGTKVALNNYDSLTPLSIGCDTFALGSGAILTAAQSTGSLPVISPYCSAVTSYTRTQPTRILYPTESVRLQSSSIKNLTMNGEFRYTRANMNLPSYYDSYQGLNETSVKTGSAVTGYYGVRSLAYTAVASAKREVVAFDYGVVWQSMKNFSLSDQVDYSDLHQPGTTTMTGVTTMKTPTDTASSTGSASINYPTLTTTTAAAGASTFEGSGVVGTPLTGYFGQKFFTNNLTGSWNATPRATFSLTYRYGMHTIAEGSPDNAPLAVGATSNGTVSIHENGGIFNAALRPSANWSLNGTVEALYADNAFTPVGARQTRRYRVHTRYRPRPWATISGAYNDLERHNNTNNNQAAVAAGDDPYIAPLNHIDYSRSVSVGAVLAPNEHYGLDVSYAYSDVYTATNICYDNGASATLPGTASTNSSGAANVCPGVYARGSTTKLADWFARDFMDAPTQYVSAAVMLSPNKTVHTNLGYRISDVRGNQFFNDARAVNGSLHSAYQSPYVNLAWTVHSGWVWKAEYNYFGYGEGGASGPEYCSTSTTTTSTVSPCTSFSEPTGLTEPSSGLTAPRNFHANNVTIGMHYEF
jgi:hypothetical protein